MITRRCFTMAAAACAASLRAQSPTFAAGTRIVEICATVYDSRGRTLPGLQRDQFEILDAGQPRRPEFFETVSSSLSLALLLDTTGSMREALPLLKNAAGRLIDRLRADDAVALFGFNDRIVCLQDFTSDFRSVKLAARRIRAEGTTSLFDALAGITQRVSERRGKKAIVAFTDGMDNSSVLNLNAATARATRAGLPVYSIAQGQALHSKQLVETLETISASTGAASYKARKPAEVEEVFDHIAGDLVNTYMLAFPVAPGKGEWHPLTVSVRVPKLSNLRVRCRQGYHAD